MGRRAVDLTTTVPVLGVPASVGARGWKTTGGDRTEGAPLQTCGHCTVGVQTSPGIRRTPVRLHETISNLIFPTSPEKQDIQMLMKNDNEKKVTLGQRTGDTKIKKEVSFKALLGETSKDVADSQKKRSGTYCYARAIKNNPINTGSATGGTSKQKPAARYMNGSVVDSEEIGGISKMNDEPVKERFPHCQAVTQEMCSLCSRKWPGTCRDVMVDRESPIMYAENPPAPALTSALTNLEVLHIDEKINGMHQTSNQMCEHGKKTKISVNREFFLKNEKPQYKRMPHPACPVHSKRNSMHLSSKHTSQPTQRDTFINTTTVTVTKATIESGQYDSSVKSISSDSKIAQLTDPPLILPKKPLNPICQLSSKLLEQDNLYYTQGDVSNNIGTSGNATPKTPLNLPSLQVGIIDRNKSSSDVCKSETSTNIQVNPTNSPSNTKAELFHAMQEAGIKHARKKNTSSQVTPKYLSLSSITKESIRFLKPDSPMCHKFRNVSLEPQQSRERSASVTIRAASGISPTYSVVNSAHIPAFANPLNKPVQHSLLRTANPDQMTCINTAYKCVLPQTHSTQPNPPNSTLASVVSKPLDSTTDNLELKSYFNETKPMHGFLSYLHAARQSNTFASVTSLFQSANTRKIFSFHDTQATDVSSQEDKRGCDIISNQELNFSTVLPSTSSETKNIPDRHKSILGANNQNSDRSTSIVGYSDQRNVRESLMHDLAAHESIDHENAECSQVTNSQNYISIITSSNLTNQGCLNAEQQKLSRYQGCREAHSKIRELQTELNAQNLTLSAEGGHANCEFDSKPDGQLPRIYLKPIVTSLHNSKHSFSQTSMQAKPVIETAPCQKTNFVISSAKCLVTTPTSLSAEIKPSMDSGCKIRSFLPSSAMLSGSRPTLHIKEVEAINTPDSKLSPAIPLQYPEGTALAHSHPCGAALLLPPSPKCSKSAGVELRLKTVEASLAANKDRIITLLNIIQDLETSHTSDSLGLCCKSGLDCSTCQKTACIVYSVEYDFRQQERHFLEVLNLPPGGNNDDSAHLLPPLTFNLLRNLINKNLKKTKLKGKKLCKTVFKWLPRKIQQL